MFICSDAISLADLQLVEGTEEVLEVMLTEDVASNEIPLPSSPLPTASLNEISSTTSL